MDLFQTPVPTFNLGVEDHLLFKSRELKKGEGGMLFGGN